MVDGLFTTAQKEIWALQVYTFTNPELLELIRTTSGRGVDVNFIFGEPTRYSRFRYAAFFGIKDIIDAGGKVWIHQSGSSPLHYKSIFVDDSLVEVGSANLNYRSYYLSKEASLVIQDKACNQQIREIFREILSASHEVTREEAKRYRDPRYFLWWCIMQRGG